MGTVRRVVVYMDGLPDDWPGGVEHYVMGCFDPGAVHKVRHVIVEPGDASWQED